jgi:hypothetical protein
VGEVTLPHTDLFVDGDWRPATGERVHEFVNAYTELETIEFHAA